MGQKVIDVVSLDSGIARTPVGFADFEPLLGRHTEDLRPLCFLQAGSPELKAAPSLALDPPGDLFVAAIRNGRTPGSAA